MSVLFQKNILKWNETIKEKLHYYRPSFRLSQLTIFKKNHKHCTFVFFRGLASSALMWHFEGLVACGKSTQIVTKTFQKSGPNCAENIRKSWAAISKMAGTGEKPPTDRRTDLTIINITPYCTYNIVYDTCMGMQVFKHP